MNAEINSAGVAARGDLRRRAGTLIGRIASFLLTLAVTFVGLTAVTFFDSAAIHALLQIAEHYGAGALRVLPSHQVRRVLEIAGLSTQPWLVRE